MRRPSLHSKRLLLRPLHKSDAPSIEAICNQRAVSETLAAVPYPYPEGGAHDWLEREAKGLAGINMAIVRKGDLIGVIGIKPSSERTIGDFVPSIGYWLDRPFWGKGYMQEAVTRLLDWYLPHEPTERIRTAVFEDNPRSLGVLQKLGFCEIGRDEGYSIARGIHMPQINLELTANRYKEAMQ